MTKLDKSHSIANRLQGGAANEIQGLKDPLDAKSKIATLLPPSPDLHIAQSLDTVEKNEVISEFKGITKAIDTCLEKFDPDDTYKLKTEFGEILGESYEPILRAKVRAFQLKLGSLFPTNDLLSINALFKQMVDFIDIKTNTKILFLQADEEQIRQAENIEQATTAKQLKIRQPYEELKTTLQELSEKISTYKDQLVALLQAQHQSEFIKKVLVLGKKIKIDYKNTPVDKYPADIKELVKYLNNALRVASTPEIANMVFLPLESMATDEPVAREYLNEEQVLKNASTLNRTIFDSEISKRIAPLNEGIEEPIPLTREVKPFQLTRPKPKQNIPTADKQIILFENNEPLVPETVQPIETQKPVSWWTNQWDKLKGVFSTQSAPNTPAISPKRITTGWRSRVAVGILSFLGMSGTAQEFKPQLEHTQASAQSAIVDNSTASTHVRNDGQDTNNQLKPYPTSMGSVSAGLNNLADANIHTGIYNSLHNAGADMWKAIYGETTLSSNTHDALAENLAWRISHAPALANFHVGRDYSKQMQVSFQGRDSNNNGIFAVTMDNMTVNVAIAIPDTGNVMAHTGSTSNIEQHQIDTAYTEAENETARFGNMINPGSFNATPVSHQSVNGLYQAGVRPISPIPAGTGGFDYQVNTYPVFSSNLPQHQPRATFTPAVGGSTPIRLGEQINAPASQRDQVSAVPSVSVESANQIAEQLNMFGPNETRLFEAAGHDDMASITFSLGNFTATFDNLSLRSNGQIYCSLGGRELSLVDAITHVINERSGLTAEAKSALTGAAARIIHAHRSGQQKTVSQADLDDLMKADTRTANPSSAQGSVNPAAHRAFEELRLSDKFTNQAQALEHAAQQAEKRGARHLAAEIRTNAERVLKSRRSGDKHITPTTAERNR